MKIEIDDDYMDVVIVGWCKEQKKFVQRLLKENDYLHEQDRLDDEEWLNALNVMLKNYDAWGDSSDSVSTS